MRLGHWLLNGVLRPRELVLRTLLALGLLGVAPQVRAGSVHVAWEPVQPAVGIQLTGIQVQACQVPAGSVTCTPIDVPGAVARPTDTDYTVTTGSPGSQICLSLVTVGTGGLEARSAPSKPVCAVLATLPNAVSNVTLAWVLSPKLVTGDSAEPGARYAATNATDGNLLTFWHTPFTDVSPGYPHTLTLDLEGVYWIGGLRYTPRQEGNLTGTIATYRLEGSKDNLTWEVLASGAFTPPDATPKNIKLSALALVRYLRLVGLSEVTGKPFASAAEVAVYQGALP